MDKFYNIYNLVRCLDDELDLVNKHMASLKYLIQENEQKLKKTIVDENKKGFIKK